jgi:hypothetical protein
VGIDVDIVPVRAAYIDPVPIDGDPKSIWTVAIRGDVVQAGAIDNGNSALFVQMHRLGVVYPYTTIKIIAGLIDIPCDIGVCPEGVSLEPASIANVSYQI